MPRTHHDKVNERRVDFCAIKAASQQLIEKLVMQWLPGGCREGDEWVTLNPTRLDRHLGSFKVNLTTGVWSDFATGDAGGDMIDLYVYLFGGTPLAAAEEVGKLVGVTPGSRMANIHTLPRAVRSVAVMTPDATQRDPETFPKHTPADHDGKPRFVVAGDSGPAPSADEKRRHFYKVGTVPVKIKVMRKNGDAQIWYRVVDTDGSIGWQLRKPVEFKETAFIGLLDPFDPEHLHQPIYWPEGEKDTDTVTAKGVRALSFGGVGDGLPEGCEEFFRGRHVIILADNDAPGRNHAEKKAALAFRVAASVRVVHFTEVPHKGDVTDFIQAGGTIEDLKQIVGMTVPYKPLAGRDTSAVSASAIIKATPYMWTDPTTIPRRDFVYGRHLIRKFVSATIAPGGIGKSSLIVTEALAMISGKALLVIQPASRLRVWLWNLEDPAEEMARHIQATAKHYDLGRPDIEGHLFADSGRDQQLVIATADRNGAVIQRPVVDNLVAEIISRGIDVLIIDPFVSSHQVGENDNNAMDLIVKEWGRVAQRANCAIELIHQTRKSSAGETETTAESSRGGKALTDGCRSVRVLNRMTKEEGENVGVENHRQHFRTYIDKANLAPPAENSDWFHLKSIDLGNSENGGYGDSVGVVTPWQWPDLMAGVSISDLRQVQAIVSKGRYRANPQANGWVGKAVAEALRLDLDKPRDKRKAANLLKVWINSGALKKIDEKDDKGMSRPFIIVGEWAND